jgi:hypothetical protein
LVGGDWEYAPSEADVVGRIGKLASPMAAVLEGRKADRRKINLRAAILSGETMIVLFAMTVFSPAFAFCSSRCRLRAHLGPSMWSHSVWLPRKAVMRLKKKKFCSRRPAHRPSQRASSRQTPHFPCPVVTRGIRIPLTTRLPVSSAAAWMSLSSMKVLGCNLNGLRDECIGASLTPAREGARRCWLGAGGDEALGALNWARIRS